MRTIFLRFADRDAALVRLSSMLGHELDAESGMLPTSGRWQGERFDVDEVGVIHAPLPTDAQGDGEEDAPADAIPEPLPGWHVNLLWWGADDAPDFGDADLAPDPTTPSRVFNI